MTKYEKIANILRKRIADGIYPPDSLLPNQIELVEEFQVSRVTIKKSINILAMEGLVYSQRGAGTRVLKRGVWGSENYSATEYDGLSQQMKDRNLTSQIITFEVKFPDDLIREKLLLDKHKPVYKIIRLRLLDGAPYVLEHTYMPTELVPDLNPSILEKSIYEYLHQQLGITFAGAYRKLKADKADQLDKTYLNCEASDPILEVEQIVYLKDGQPIEYSRSRNRYDQRSYSVLDVIE
ncbi:MULTISPECIES: GntR family transcriptional regulator [Enterococcus]|uniref:GntR family transcriptional regulator n=1 Tax=Enterococcus alcedinis TaxID=1274384 RepID=A0A917JG54_9ENTE|nr:GntR family transcriptional regulator [Enterococcus alcedinis]MBP2101929.1 GntR family transcriptional regulator [Enterococcus alcedinis]GGI65492.1 GntR family transcriptional regulator [Enterococcus alcedinis]